jgi:hypothetical protein
MSPQTGESLQPASAKLQGYSSQIPSTATIK